MGFLSKVTGGISSMFGLPSAGQLWDDFTGKSAVDKQNEYNMQMWKMQNEYNTPANQVKRYREAGLNPNLIYGNGTSSAGNASSAPEMVAHHGSAKKALDLAQFVLNLKNMKAQNANLNAQTGNINAQTQQHLADVEYKMALVDFYKEHGYFPGQSSAPTNIVKEVMNSSPVQKAEEGLSRFLGSVVGAATRDYDGDPDRGRKMAVDIANKKGLKGKDRERYINEFMYFYKATH